MWVTAVTTVWRGFTSLLSALAKWAGYFFAYRLGKRKAQHEQTQENVEIKDAQLKIMGRPSLHRDALLERMRRRSRK